MIAHPASVVVTARIVGWCDDRPDRQAWLVECLARHNSGDWGDLDADDHAVNDHARRRQTGRVLSAYSVPTQLGPAVDDDSHVWVITDDLDDPDTATTILWPSDY